MRRRDPQSPRLGQLRRRHFADRSGYELLNEFPPDCLGLDAKLWSPVEVGLACSAISRWLLRRGVFSPAPTTQQLPYFKKQAALGALTAALPTLTEQGQALVTRLIARIQGKGVAS